MRPSQCCTHRKAGSGSTDVRTSGLCSHAGSLSARTVSSFDKGKATQTYSLPVTASWQIDLFGQLLNPKRKAQVSLKQTQFYEQAVQTQVIANVANMYYTLLMLDRQLQISESTCDILKRNLETVEAMKEAAMLTVQP